MTAGGNDLRCAGLRFFGAISASVTHELKNTFAIMKELSGLEADLAAAAARGKPLDPERIRDLAGRIGAQVVRADEIVKRMNRFSHSVDRPRASADLREVLRTILDLCQRFADRQRVEIIARLPEGPLVVETDPFVIQHAVYLALRRALETVGEGGRAVVSLAADGAGARVEVAGGDPVPEPGEEHLRGLLAGILGARIVEGETWTLCLPAVMPKRQEEP